MRPIKFRAWYKNRKQMLGVVSIDLEQGYRAGIGHVTLDFGFDGHISIDPRFLELMQFTGLQDKNGKEIWEGDVIQVNNEDWDGPSKHRIFWDKYGCMFQLSDSPDDGQDFIPSLGTFAEEPYEFEVLGNIYENPELLK